MNSDKTAMGDRLKKYEAATHLVLPRRTYTIIRVDGRAFHTLLKKAAKPYDWHFIETMDKVAQELCKGIENALMAYVQSDEVSVVLSDFKTHATEPWFGGVVQKMASVSASLATYHFSNGYGAMGLFDSRVYTIPSKTEVMNYLVWRQKDSTRNSVNMLARAYFSTKELHGKSTLQRRAMLAFNGTPWETEPARFTHGGLCVKETYEVEPDPSALSTATTRTRFVTSGATIFEAKQGSCLDELIPTME